MAFSTAEGVWKWDAETPLFVSPLKRRGQNWQRRSIFGASPTSSQRPATGGGDGRRRRCLNLHICFTVFFLIFFCAIFSSFSPAYRFHRIFWRHCHYFQLTLTMSTYFLSMMTDFFSFTNFRSFQPVFLKISKVLFFSFTMVTECSTEISFPQFFWWVRRPQGNSTVNRFLSNFQNLFTRSCLKDTRKKNEWFHLFHLSFRSVGCLSIVRFSIIGAVGSFLFWFFFFLVGGGWLFFFYILTAFWLMSTLFVFGVVMVALLHGTAITTGR